MGTLPFLQHKSKLISKQEAVVVAVVIIIKRTAVTEVGNSRQLLEGLDSDYWSICWSPCLSFCLLHTHHTVMAFLHHLPPFSAS